MTLHSVCGRSWFLKASAGALFMVSRVIELTMTLLFLYSSIQCWLLSYAETKAFTRLMITYWHKRASVVYNGSSSQSSTCVTSEPCCHFSHCTNSQCIPSLSLHAVEVQQGKAGVFRFQKATRHICKYDTT